jgi:6-phosphogluconolactonase
MENFFETREQASVAAAEFIVNALHKRLASQPEAALVVGGGTSPGRCFTELSNTPMDWERVHVILSDERWVSEQDDASNTKLVRENLVQGEAAAARLLPIYDSLVSIEDRCDSLQEIIPFLSFPFACSMLGMGEDGHFASLFPDADNLAAGLDVDGDKICIAVSTAASAQPRWSLTLAALSHSDEIALLFFGDAKRKVYEQAKQPNTDYPVSKLLLQKRAPVHVFWAP